jgi:hypothetical protein
VTRVVSAIDAPCWAGLILNIEALALISVNSLSVIISGVQSFSGSASLQFTALSAVNWELATYLSPGARSRACLAGLQRQCSGTAGATTDADRGLSSRWWDPRGRSLSDRDLYLRPRSRRPEPVRKAGVLDGVPFSSKPNLGKAMLGRALDAWGATASWATAQTRPTGRGATSLFAATT